MACCFVLFICSLLFRIFSLSLSSSLSPFFSMVYQTSLRPSRPIVPGRSHSATSRSDPASISPAPAKQQERKYAPSFFCGYEYHAAWLDCSGRQKAQGCHPIFERVLHSCSIQIRQRLLGILPNLNTRPGQLPRSLFQHTHPKRSSCPHLQDWPGHEPYFLLVLWSLGCGRRLSF